MRGRVRLQQLGFEIRRARLARGLTQAQLAAAAGLSRTTINQLENGSVADLGIRKLQDLIKPLGLTLSITPSFKSRGPDFLQMAATTASVSYKHALTEDELLWALLTGKAPAGRRPHLRSLLDEAPPSLLTGVVSEVIPWTKPGRIEKNLSKLARETGASRAVDEWLKSA